MAQTTNVGHMSAWSLARSRGYTGTREEYAELMASYATVAEQAAESAQSASSSAQGASQAASSANAAMNNALTAESNAQSAASGAQGYAQSAQQSAQSASQSAQNAESAKNTAVSTVDGFDSHAQQALDSVNQAGNNWKSLAQAKALDSEAYAFGSRDGEDVGTSDPAYHNNAKYYAEQGCAEVTAAQQARQGAESAQALAETAQGKAEEAQTAAETAQVKAEEAAERADVKSDGTYDNMTVGSAKQIISSKYTVETEPYTFRASGGDGADREYDEIVGGSIVWNQLSKVNSINWGSSYGGITVTKVDDKTIKISGICATSSGSVMARAYTTDVYFIPNHVYFTDGYDDKFYVYIGNSSTSRRIKKPTVTGENAVVFGVYNGSDFGDGIEYTIQLFDLTQMFGSEIADYIYNLEQTTPGAGVAWFRKYFPKDYYEYNAGELMHVSDLQSHDMVGRNQCGTFEIGTWRETTEKGSEYSQLKSDSLIRARSVDLVPVIYPMTVSIGEGYQFALIVFDSNRKYLGSSSFVNFHSNVFTLTNAWAENGAFVAFVIKRNDNGNFLSADIENCHVQLEFGATATEYEPYVKHSYPLDSSLTLRGIPKLSTDGKLYYDGDRYKADGTVERRYGVVDLSALEWTTKATGSTHKSVYTALPAQYTGHPRGSVDFLSDAYMPSITGYYSGSSDSKITSPDDSEVGFLYYSNSNSAKQRTLYLIIGVNDTPAGYLIYTLAEPTTETADPYQSLQITDPYGTEEYVTTGIVPVGHETKYPENLRAKIEGLPWDFSSLIAPTENGTASRNYTVGSLLIMGNVLYKVTANIANGGAITPNTNVTATTLSEVISALV